MRKNIYLVILTILTFSNIKSQNYLPKDTVFGNIKKIREKVIFLTEVENPQLIYYNDYGHSGFMGPESTISRFKDTWYTTNLSYFINYERNFDVKGNIISDVWFGKKDNFLNSYKKIFDSNNRILKEIDSTNYSIYITNYYYSDYGDVNIIRQNSKNNYFRHTYRKYEKDKLITLKEFDENGTVDEYKYFYNKNGKLSFRIYKDPNSWKNEGERSWSYGVQDSILTVYKELVNEYDTKNRLVKQQKFDLYEDDEEHKNPLLTNQTDFVYIDDKLTLLKRRYRTGIESFEHFKYNKLNQITARYCCDKNIDKAMIIEEYKFDKDNIKSLKYTEEKKVYDVSFRYKFDSKNNWVEIIKAVDGKDLFKWVRQIEYY